MYRSGITKCRQHIILSSEVNTNPRQGRWRFFSRGVDVYGAVSHFLPRRNCFYTEPCRIRAHSAVISTILLNSYRWTINKGLCLSGECFRSRMERDEKITLFTQWYVEESGSSDLVGHSGFSNHSSPNVFGIVTLHLACWNPLTIFIG